MNRTSSLSRLTNYQNETYDLAIIGGGASGFGVAIDALSRGLSVVLLDKSDFAKGTSSRSTKLLHGGVRYLAQGDVFLVLEALKERGRLLENAPHLTVNQTFVIPIYSFFDQVKYSAGLKLYDWMAGGLRLGKSRSITREETIKRVPGLKKDGLKGGVIYQDGQFDDARMVIALARTCDDLGATLLNYAKVEGLSKDVSGKIDGVIATDLIGSKKLEIKAKMVVNATGVFADKILQMDQPQAPKSIQPSQGIHLVFDKSFLGGEDALMIPKTSDGRVLFAVPWQNHLLIGTTDTIRKKPKLEPEALEQEIDFVLETAQKYLAKTPTRQDVLSVFAGLRPLAAPKEEGAKTKEISRSHKVIVSESKLVTITGGKWTTFRKMGEDTVEFYKAITANPLSPSKSAKLKIHGATNTPIEGIYRAYGTDADEIMQMVKNEPSLGNKLHPNHPYTEAMVVWAVRNEMAEKLEDVLSRRLRLLMCDAKAAIVVAPRVAALMAEEAGNDADWIAKEIEDFKQIAHKYLINPETNAKIHPGT
jgi:glycerol-3-phosphate dehydrogenase